MVLELVPGDGGEPQRFVLTTAQAMALVADAHAAAQAQGFGWDREPLKLFPAPKLAALIRESRRLAAKGEGEETE